MRALRSGNRIVVIPRKHLDIGLTDLIYAVASCLKREDRHAIERRIETLWTGDGNSLVCLSVRSGFDALLGALNWPQGSEVQVSALTIGDMPRIAEAHGIVPIPVDLDPGDLSVSVDSLRRALSPRTKAILVAHLFGSRMPMEPILEFAKSHGLLVIEDCAQAYAADDYRGDRESDVSLFSFGAIKTASALQGAILHFRDSSLKQKVQLHQDEWPVQTQRHFLARVAKYALLVILAHRPIYSLFVSICRFAGVDHDRLIANSVRGFAGADFFRLIRRRTCPALLNLLERRLTRYERREIIERIASARLANRLLPWLERPGDQAKDHSYWLYPVLHDDPDELTEFLRCHGFDATRGASSMYVVEPPPDRPELRAANAQRICNRLLYLPVHSRTSRRDNQRLIHCLRQFEAIHGHKIAEPTTAAFT